jgi:thiol-disulfide isomerase/thioredoxin
MQKIFIILFVSIGLNGYAQKDSTPIPLYLKTRQVPGFKLLLMDSSTYFYKYQLKKSTPTVIIYFNPDCEHCKTETKNLMDSINYVQDVQFVLASYSAFGEIKKFDSIYNLAAQKNIKVGRDEKFFIPVFYQVRFTPFVAVYNKNGELLKAFEGGTTIKNLMKVLGKKK